MNAVIGRRAYFPTASPYLRRFSGYGFVFFGEGLGTYSVGNAAVMGFLEALAFDVANTLYLGLSLNIGSSWRAKLSLMPVRTMLVRFCLKNAALPFDGDSVFFSGERSLVGRSLLGSVSGTCGMVTQLLLARCLETVGLLSYLAALSKG